MHPVKKLSFLYGAVYRDRRVEIHFATLSNLQEAGKTVCGEAHCNAEKHKNNN